MTLYFTDAQVPELAALTRAHRRIVWRGAFDMLCKERPSFRSQQRGITFLLVFTGILFALWVSEIVGAGPGILVAGGLVWIVGLIWQSFVTEWLRPFFRAYVEQHKDEFGIDA